MSSGGRSRGRGVTGAIVPQGQGQGQGQGCRGRTGPDAGVIEHGGPRSSAIERQRTQRVKRPASGGIIRPSSVEANVTFFH